MWNTTTLVRCVLYHALERWSCSVFLCCRDLLTYYSLGDQVHFDVFLNRLTYDVTS